MDVNEAAKGAAPANVFGSKSSYPEAIQNNKNGGGIGDGHDDMPDPATATFLTGLALSTGPELNRTQTTNGNRGDRNVIAKTLMTMDLPRINFMRREIKKRKDGLGKVDFVITMGTCVVGDISNPIVHVEQLDMKIVADFCEVFAQIDVNNDGIVDWEELSSFILAMGMKGWAESGAGMPAYSYAGPVDGAQPTLAADQIKYFSGNDTVAVLEPCANFFRVYDAAFMHLRREYDIKNSWGSARAVCYSNVTGHYVLATSSSKVCFYEEGSGIAWKIFDSPSTSICIAMAESHNLLVGGDTIGNLYSWSLGNVCDISTDDSDVRPYNPFGGLFHRKRQACHTTDDAASSVSGGHTDAILDILALADTGVLASCGMDRTVKLWDLHTLGLRNTLLGHPKGVRHIAYCPDHRLIVSGGFCYDLIVSNPYVSNPISRLYGHSAPIVGVEHVEGTSELITADADGACKLWDLRTFSCLHTFTARGSGARRSKMTAPKKWNDTSGFGATREAVRTCMAVIPPYKRVLVGGRSVVSFEVLRDECEDLTDDTAVLAVWFNSTNLTFVTASAWAVKVWDGATGELLCADARQNPGALAAGVTSEITSICLGTRGRRIIVGDGSGHIQVFNHINHLELKNYKYSECKGKAHEGDVRALVFVEEHTLLISASGDRSISIHDDSKRDNGALLRRITNASWSGITAIRYSAHLGLIATGNTDGSIQLWNFELATHEGCCMEQHGSPVTCLAFLDPFPVLLSTDLAGHVALWALPPSRDRLRFTRLFTWINKQPLSSEAYGGAGGLDGMVPVAVTAIECQVETIATSIASTLSASSAASSSALAGDGLASREGQHYPFLSFEEGGNVNKQDDDDADAASAGSGPSPSQDKGEISTAGGRAAEGSSGGSGGGKKDGPSEDRRKAKKRGSSGADGGDGIPSPETEVPADGGGNDSGGGGSGGGKADADGGSASGIGDSSASADPSGQPSHDRSFQGRLAATFLKYQGARRRYGTASSGKGRDRGGSSSSQQLAMYWNTDMLSYTMYAADDGGRVTTWDLKGLLLELTHSHGGYEWAGHGVGVVASPVVYSNVRRNLRYDAADTLHRHQRRLHARARSEWLADSDTLGLYRIGSWEAHTQPIECLNLVTDPPTVLTAAMDRLVKLWSPAGDLLGVLRPKQDPDTPWAFRVNREAHEESKRRVAREVVRTRQWAESTVHAQTEAGRMLTQVSARRTIPNSKNDDPSEDDDSAEDVGDSPLDYSYNFLGDEGAVSPASNKSRGLVVPRLRLPGESRSRVEAGDADWGLRKTPRRVPVRPSTSGRRTFKRVGAGDPGVTRGSPRTNQGHLVSSKSLSAR